MFPNIVTIVGNFAAEWDKQNHTYNNLLTTKPPEVTIVTHRSISLNKTWLKPYISQTASETSATEIRLLLYWGASNCSKH